jgi:hypothetical protein
MMRWWADDGECPRLLAKHCKDTIILHNQTQVSEKFVVRSVVRTKRSARICKEMPDLIGSERPLPLFPTRPKSAIFPPIVRLVSRKLIER